MSNNLLLRRRMMMQAGGSPTPVPYDAEVEYIRSDKTQSDIILNYNPNPLTEFYLTIDFSLCFYKTGAHDEIFTSPPDNDYNVFSANFGGNSNQYTTIFYWFRKAYGHGGNICNVIYNVSQMRKGIMHLNNQTSKVRLYEQEVNIQLPITTNPNPLTILFHNNIYSFTFYELTILENNSIVRQYKPVRIGSAGYIYDSITQTLCGNGEHFIFGRDIPTNILGYSAVDYIESTGFEFIDLPVTVNAYDDLELEFVFELTDYPPQRCYLFKSNTNNYSSARYSISDDNMVFESQISNAYPHGGFTVFYNTITQLQFSTKSLNGVALNRPLKSNITSLRILDNYVKARIYSLKIKINDVIVMDLQPVRNQNIGFLYDSISGNLYGNSSNNGAFNIGNDI